MDGFPLESRIGPDLRQRLRCRPGGHGGLAAGAV